MTAVERLGKRMKKTSPPLPTRVPIAPEERLAPLDARRRAKMATSAHAFVRGTTEVFYAWLAGPGKKKLPEAPRIWVSGDCHVGNLGPLANLHGAVQIELRDLDQTVIGSPAYDVLRLALSLAMAVRASALPGYVTARLVESIARGYERVLETHAARREAEPIPAPPALAKLVRVAAKRSMKHLLGERIGKDDARLFPIGKRYWPLSSDERDAVLAFFATKPAHDLMTALTKRPDDAHVRVVDAVYWVKGCSSLGLWRCAAMVEVTDARKAGAKVDTERSLALIDIKEAARALAPKAPRSRVPAHQGERVVTGARVLAPSLGERMIATTILDKEVFVRELLPQDLKFDLNVLTEEEALAIGGYLAAIVATAHARQLEPSVCAEWLVELRRVSATNIDAPAWLWSCVVDLVAHHEAAYLEHCREHALRSPVTEALQTPDLVRHKVDGN